MIKTSFLLRAILLFAACSLTPTLSQAQNQTLSQDAPFLRLDGKPYDLQTLTGFSQAELDKLIDAQLPKLNDAQLLNGPVDMQTLAQGKDTRARREELYRANARFGILFDISSKLVAAATFDNIVATHGFDPEKYVDFAAAIEHEKRYQQFVDFFNAIEPTTVDKEKEFYQRAVKEYNYQLDFADWQDLQHLRQTNALGKVSAAFNTNNPDVLAKSHLVAFLIQDAIKSGVYNQKAREVFSFSMSSLYQIELTDFKGDVKSAQTFADSVTDENGVFQSKAFAVFKSSFAKSIERAQLRSKPVFGSEIREQFGFPVMGRVYNIAPDTYRFFALQSKLQIEENAGSALFHKVYATELVASDYMPAIEWGALGTVPLDLLRGSLATANFGVELKAPEVVKLPYPATEFAEIPALREQIDRFLVLYSRAKAQGNPAEMSATVQTFKEATKDVATKAGQHLVARTLQNVGA